METPNSGRGWNWLARFDSNLSSDQAYCQYQEISREDRWTPFSFGNAWSASHPDHPAIKRVICQMPIPKLERMVLIRFQGLHPPWVSTAEWEFLMWFALALERDRSWSAAWQHTDPRHPGYNGARAKLAPEPVIVECSGLGGGDLQLAQQWHVCIKTNKHNQRIYGPSMALVEESIRLPDKSMIHGAHSIVSNTPALGLVLFSRKYLASDGKWQNFVEPVELSSFHLGNSLIVYVSFPDPRFPFRLAVLPSTPLSKALCSMQFRISGSPLKTLTSSGKLQ